MEKKASNELNIVKNEVGKINEINKDALTKQRESYEQRMKEMEDEVTNASLTRYKQELDQKQKLLKMTKKLDL